MTVAPRLEVFVGIPAWLVAGYAIYLSWSGEPMLFWGPVGMVVFAAVWLFGFLSKEREFFK